MSCIRVVTELSKRSKPRSRASLQYSAHECTVWTSCIVSVTFKMFNPKRALLYAFLIALLLEPITGRRGFSGGHSYPKSSSGLSGGGHRSGGLSGGGSHHGYPPAGGVHSSGSHGYPSSGGGLSGSGSSGGAHTYPSSGAKPAYPSHGGSSGGSHGYPPAGGGLSGNSHRSPQNTPTVHHTTNIHNYHYSPPQQISYTPVGGGAPRSYPVYHGTPPTYVYQYKNSDSKYGTLLAGLALLNLGTLGVAAYAASNSHGKTQYTPQPGEVCKFAIQKDNGDREETRIDCQIISSFILQDQAQSHTTGTNTTTSVVTVTNTTIMNMTNMMPEQPSAPAPVTPVANVVYVMQPNGTLVPVNVTVPVVPTNVTQNITDAQAQNPVITSSVVTTTTTNTTLVNALDVKGKPVEVTPGMQCFVIRNSPTHSMKKSVPCGLLQTYADKSIQRKNSATRNGPLFTIVAAILAFCVAY